ncbi:MAG: hypothetical protein RRY36_05270 [Bacteroidaceae bacterium]
MEKEGVYWRTGGKITNCGVEILPSGKDIEYIIISTIDYKDEHIINGRKEKNVWVATFATNPYTKLPMILNSTNRKRLTKLYPTCNGMINLLENIPIRLCKEKCKDAQDGGQTWGLRISNIPARIPNQTKPILALGTPDFDKAKAYIISGGIIDNVKQKFDIPQEVEQKLYEK